MATVTLQGNTINLNGDLPAVGADAPDFQLVDAELNDRSLADFAGKKKLLDVVVSLDTLICENSVKAFNEKLGGRDDVAVLIVSADLPATAARLFKTIGADKVAGMSMMRSRNFAKDYGLLITDGPLAGVTARAVVVIDENNKVAYTELVPEITQEPDYDAAIAALKETAAAG